METAENNNYSILIIDDEPLLTKTLTAILGSKGFEVKNTALGKDGLELLKEGFDLLLLDIKLPDTNGLEVLKQVKLKFPQTIVILITAYASVETAVTAMNEGAYTYLTKPFEVDELLSAINGAFEKKRLDAERERILNSLTLLYKVNKELEGVIELHSIARLAARYFAEAVNIEVCAILLIDQKTREFRFGALNGVPYDIGYLAQKRFKLGRKMYKTLIEEYNAVLIPELKTKPDILEYVPVENPKSLFIFPIGSKNNIVGLCVFISRQIVELSEEDLKVISEISSEVAGYIENANLYLQLKHNYLSAVATLVKAIEGKNKYTQGHSEVVAEFAVAVGREMNLSNDEIESIRFAGLLHDIGKIAISEQILLKKEALTTDEYVKLKMHTIVSTDVVRRLGISERLIRIVLYHHERYDGAGYPEGLREKAIPIGARILAVCDAYEALVSDRPYRDPFSKEKAIAELKRCAGTQFDPQVVNVFIEILAKEDRSIDKPNDETR